MLSSFRRVPPSRSTRFNHLCRTRIQVYVLLLDPLYAQQRRLFIILFRLVHQIIPSFPLLRGDQSLLRSSQATHHLPQRSTRERRSRGSVWSSKRFQCERRCEFDGRVRGRSNVQSLEDLFEHVWRRGCGYLGVDLYDEPFENEERRGSLDFGSVVFSFPGVATFLELILRICVADDLHAYVEGDIIEAMA